MEHEQREVYVVLTDTGTWFARLIRLYTRQELNHASIVLDKQFKEVYSFGRKKANNPFIGGFVKEDMHHSLFERADCAIYRCRMSKDQYDKLQFIIRGFERRSDVFRYNLIGLIGVIFNRPIRRRCAYFCSQFVASVFERAGHPIVDKCAALTKPSDFACSDQLEFVYRGDLYSFLVDREQAEELDVFSLPAAVKI